MAALGHHRELAVVVGSGGGGGGFSGGGSGGGGGGAPAAASRIAARGRRRRYTRAMGATDTMEVFFERLNEGDVAAAVALMDERTEMRIHVGDNARTLRGVEQVGGWFLRADKGLKMIPGDVRDLGNTYAGRPRRPPARAPPASTSTPSSASRPGKITSINLTPFSR